MYSEGKMDAARINKTEGHRKWGAFRSKQPGSRFEVSFRYYSRKPTCHSSEEMLDVIMPFL